MPDGGVAVGVPCDPESKTDRLDDRGQERTGNTAEASVAPKPPDSRSGTPSSVKDARSSRAPSPLDHMIRDMTLGMERRGQVVVQDEVQDEVQDAAQDEVREAAADPPNVNTAQS